MTLPPWMYDSEVEVSSLLPFLVREERYRQVPERKSLG